MHIHILGIGGTFMSALALLAREAGFQVTGSDANCYSPISDLLMEKGIEWTEGYADSQLALQADCVIVGNAIKRGMPVIEEILNAGKRYISGPQWLAENILLNYRVIAVAGTHGKTTVTSMLAYILDYAGLNPGFLIGGVSPAFNTSASLGAGKWFVIEADEYDSAFFDKRPKCIHYHPEIAIINNLEFDHADIYPDLKAIQQQFHYFLNTIPSGGLLIKPHDDAALNDVVEKGVFCRVEDLALKGDATWRAEVLDQSGQHFRVLQSGKPVADVNWPLIGQFNVENALAAIAASAHAGVQPSVAAEALSNYSSVKRRLEVKSTQHDIVVYDDFAHHPTAIAKTIEAVKKSGRHKRILVVLELASYTMRHGLHDKKMTSVVDSVDAAYILKPSNFNLEPIAAHWRCPYQILPDTQAIVEAVSQDATPGDAILIMSNRNVDNIDQRIIENIRQRFST